MQDWASMWVLQRWTNFCSKIWKGISSIPLMSTSQDTHNVRSLKLIGACHSTFCVRMLLVQTNYMFFGFINYEYQRIEFQMLLKKIVNMFRRAKGFGCLLDGFEFWVLEPLFLAVCWTGVSFWSLNHCFFLLFTLE